MVVRRTGHLPLRLPYAISLLYHKIMTFHNQIPVGTKPGLWTLNWTVDWTVAWTVAWTMDWTVDWTVDWTQ